MSDQKHQNLKELANTGQIVDHTNVLLELSSGDQETTPELKDSELEELVSDPEMLPKPEEPGSNLQPKPQVEEHTLSPGLRSELKEPGSSSELRQELKGLEINPELISDLRQEPKQHPDLKEVELKQELKEPETSPVLKQESSPKLKEMEQRQELKQPQMSPELFSDLRSGQKEQELHQELKEVELKEPKTSAELSQEPKEPQSIRERKEVESRPELMKAEEPGLRQRVMETRPEKQRPEPRQTVLESRSELRPATTKQWTKGVVGLLIAIVLVIFLIYLNKGTPNLEHKTAPQIFQDEFKSLQKDFPGQSQALWLRSGKMLTSHLNKSLPGEPATIILTAAQDARRTLLCLGSGLAQSYAIAHNSSWLIIHGPSEAKYDDSTAKFHIDEKLSKGFESEHRAAVLNHLETLPPGALLILYKYCDHENAAYKNVALLLTVLLEDSSLDPDTPLPDLEEKVRDFLWQQFIISNTVRSHQEMDSDKLGGVWSRISHLVLPVLPVKSIESGNCPFDYK